jgi:membrane-associated phospholipid phosphatase
MILQKITNIDLKISAWMYSKRQKWLTLLMVLITNTMEKWLIVPIIITFFGILKLDNWQFVYFWFWTMVFFTVVTNYILKKIFKRSRPFESQLVNERFYSFPSGHVMTAYQIAFQSLYLSVQNSQSITLSLGLLFLAILFVLVIAFSRVYLGVHYLSDTIGSVIFGSITVIISIMVFQLLS